MGIKAKKKKWALEGMKLEVQKKMSHHGQRKIDNLNIRIFTPSNLTNDQLKVIKNEIKNCPVLKNIKDSININLLWTKQ